MSSPRTPYALCPHKTKLLEDYIAALGLYNTGVDEYSELLRNRINGDLLTLVRQRMQESRERTTAARKRYATHLREHRCDSPI